ncbi:MAG: hypothetical protein JWM95_1786 [Gemmatimonadetes bacterium]|nr:hypothetical protein [Gemmatimonadota bacterium]
MSTITLLRALSSALLLTPAALAAQTIRVVARAPVVLDLPGRPLGEPTLAVHPADSRHLLAAAMVHDPTAKLGDTTRARIGCAAFVSLDDGATWRQHIFDVRGCFDPSIVITPSGRAVFAALGLDPTAPQQGDVLLVFNSPDGGSTWDKRAVSLGRGHDHPMVVVDQSDSARADWVYVVSSLMARADNAVLRFGLAVARSRNGARRFDPLTFLRPTTLMGLAETPAVLSDGTLVVPYVEPALGDGRTMLPRRRAWLLKSRDGGFEFSRPLYVNEACGSSTAAFSLSALAADPSTGASRDRLYFACNQASPSDVVVSASDDRGESWTVVRPVGGLLADSTMTRKLMGTAVSSRGILGVVWVERGRNVGDRCAEDVYFTASTDGGKAFLPAERIASGAACAVSRENGEAFPGDYFGLATDSEGRFRLLWSGVGERLLRLRLATIEVVGASPSSRSP